MILISTTSCKRIKLLTEMFESLLEHFEFGPEINNCKFFVVDDNSETKELDDYENQFPFVELHRKGQHDKGHSKSMNIIRDKAIECFAEYLIHIEDDMKFVSTVSIPELLERMKIINVENNFCQILFNQDYSETGLDYRVSKNRLVNFKGFDFVLHNHENQKLEKEQPSGHEYWPGFSLRPSIISVEALKKTGAFHNVAHFEREYADRMYSLGYRSIFLPGHVHLHTGKLTSQSHLQNAYSLNNTGQFVFDLPVWVINLDKCQDRLAKMKLAFPNLNRLVAIDGATHIMSKEERELFKNNDYNYRRGIIGCWLSHIKLWKTLLTTAHNTWLVLEDDAIMIGSQDQINKLANVSGYDVCLLYFTPWNKNIDMSTLPSPIFWPSVSYSLSMSMGGTVAYLITRAGVHKLLRELVCNPPVNAVDTWIQKLCGKNNSFGGSIGITYSNPMLFSTVEGESNVQFDHVPCK